MRRALLLPLSFFATLSLLAGEVGPEIPVTETGGEQRNVVVSSTSDRTLIAFDERTGDGPDRVVLHQYGVFVGMPAGRETFTVEPSTENQRRPALGHTMIGWVDEDPAGGKAWLTWQMLGRLTSTDDYGPVFKAERVEEAAPGTTVSILHRHVFHVLVWTAPDGRLKSVERSLVARIGYDRSSWYVTNERAFHPAAAGVTVSSVDPIVAYNYEIAPGQYGIRAAGLWGRSVQPPVDIAPAGASEPRVVWNGTDFVILWSMESGGTYAQRVTSMGGVTVKIGGVQKLDEGVLHDGAVTSDGEYLVVVDQGMRFAVLRLDRNLALAETTVFHARLPEGERISIDASPWHPPLLAYASQTLSRAVFRTLSADDKVSGKKRRSSR
ncbi:MAG TPA: hypothetical protein VEO54_09070 [Thermoanaerobaculia bacterium]|nr:hypothetical protein [Thermoanaerobaculia bacterium]